MAAAPGSVWAIDVGNTSLKALGVRLADEGVEVIGFDNIEHAKVLTSPGVKEDEREELITASLRQLAERHDFSKDEIVISVGGQNSFAWFIKLPPVERKGIPKIIQYEAVQQIPFDINEVEWDWQLMEKPGSKEVEAGIFAIKKELVNRQMEHFGRENMKVTCVQMAPMALYNYAVYDRKDLSASGTQGVIVLDMGAENTDLVICTQTNVWQRSISVGGNAFTRAIAESFKLSFTKAEKLKRTAPMSKYARQILQAMKPVFADLATEIQRSLGFYASSNRQTKLSKIIALGGGVKLQGLTKFLQQTLQMPVVRPDSFEKLAVGPGVSAAKFHENVGNFGIVYGLALQGLGLGKIRSNLLPRRIARMMTWSRKSKYFTAAAAAFVVVCSLCLVRAGYDRSKYSGNSEVRRNYKTVVQDVQQAIAKCDEEKKKSEAAVAEIEKRMGLFKYRDVVAYLNEKLIACLPNAENNPEQAEFYRAFAGGDVDGVTRHDRKKRKQLFVTGVSIRYSDDLGNAKFGQRARRSTKQREGGLAGRRGLPDTLAGGFGRRRFRMLRGGDMAAPSTRQAPGRTKQTGAKKEAEAKKASGFLVVMEGYSPYEEIMDLLDPAEVDTEKTRWGVMTRFRKLQEIFPNCPFELYSIEHEHFEIKRGEVDLSAKDMPEGIGLEQTRTTGAGTEFRDELTIRRPGLGKKSTLGTTETVLIDPMTEEIISRTVQRDERGQPLLASSNVMKYQVNDHWFRIKAKFVWKGAPEEAAAKVSGSPQTGRMRRGS